MLTYLISFLLLRKFGLPKSLRYRILLFLAGVFIVVSIYTMNLVLTLPERTSGHVYTLSSR